MPKSRGGQRKSAASRWSTKRARIAPVSDESDQESDADEVPSLEALTERVEQLELERTYLQRPLQSHGAVYNLWDPRDRENLARCMWAGNYRNSMATLREMNAPLVALLDILMSNTYVTTEERLLRKDRLVDGILADLVRGQSIRNCPLLTAAVSIVARYNHVPREFHNAISYMHRGALLSETWVRKFLPLAVRMRPAIGYEPLDRIAVATFDNFQINAQYKSYVVGGMSGIQLKMTNWMTTSIPKSLASPSFDAVSVCEREPCVTPCAVHKLATPLLAVRRGPFRADVSLSHFCRLFNLDSPSMLANKEQRWRRFLKACGDGRMLDRPGTQPRWVPEHRYYHPIDGRLQSSYEDVEAEMTVICETLRQEGLAFLFLAGDGLSLMRVNHLLAHHPDKYIFQTPMVLPIQGDMFIGYTYFIVLVILIKCSMHVSFVLVVYMLCHLCTH